MTDIYYYELKLRYKKGKKQIREYSCEDYAVTSAEELDDILKGHTWDRMYRKYYGPRYDGKVEIKITEVTLKKRVGSKIRSQEELS